MEVTPIPFSQLRDEVLRMYAPPHRAKKTRNQMAHMFRVIEDLGVQSTADITTDLVARVIETRPPENSPRTTLAVLRAMRVAFNHAMISGYIRVSPFALRSVGKWIGRIGPPKKGVHFSKAEIASVLAQAAAEVEELRGWPQYRARRLQCLIAIGVYCGLRRSELLNLHVEDWDPERRLLWIRDRSRSGGYRLKTEAAAQPVPVPSACAAVINDWLTHRLDAPPGFEVPACPWWMIPNLRRRGPWTGGPTGHKPLDQVKALAARAGVEGFTLQSMRRSLATHLEHHGTGQAMITRILRHTTETTTKRYYQQADAANLSDAVESFDY